MILSASPAFASDPVGIYGWIETVTYQPDRLTATKVRIDGTFATARINNGDYGAPVRGFLYYVCPLGLEVTCRMEWADIEKSITYSCAGWGGRRDPLMPQNALFNGTIHAPGTMNVKAEDYPIVMGVVMLPKGSLPCDALIAGPLPPADMASQPPPDMAFQPPLDMAQGDMAKPVIPLAAGCAIVARPTPGAGLPFLLLGLVALALRLRRRSGATE